MYDRTPIFLYYSTFHLQKSTTIKDSLSQATMLQPPLHPRDNRIPNKDGLPIFFLLVALTLICALILFSFYVLPKILPFLLLSPLRQRRHDNVPPPPTATTMELATLPHSDDAHTHHLTDSPTTEGQQHEGSPVSHAEGNDGSAAKNLATTSPTKLPRVYHYRRQSFDNEPLHLSGMAPVEGVDMV